MTGEELGPLFTHPAVSYNLWILVLLVGVPAAAIAGLGLVRGQLSPALASAGLVALPAFAYLLGNFALMERSKSVEFCGSCHETMSPIVTSLSEDNGSIAATHWRQGAVGHANACYSCHSGYGIWGDVGAKTAGIVHMLHTVTGDYEYPLTMASTYDISACLNCHAESARFRAVEAHRDPDLQNSLLSGEIGCAGLCHPPAHPPDALMGASR